MDSEMDIEWLHSTFLRSKIESDTFATIRDTIQALSRICCEFLNPSKDEIIVDHLPVIASLNRTSAVALSDVGQETGFIDRNKDRNFIQNLVISVLWILGKFIQVFLWLISMMFTAIVHLSDPSFWTAQRSTTATSEEMNRYWV